jgi:hypothetical protein
LADQPLLHRDGLGEGAPWSGVSGSLGKTAGNDSSNADKTADAYCRVLI